MLMIQISKSIEGYAVTKFSSLQTTTTPGYCAPSRAFSCIYVCLRIYIYMCAPHIDGGIGMALHLALFPQHCILGVFPSPHDPGCAIVY